MPTVAVIGGQWGDEGKGKIVDYLAQEANVVARFSGGSNAGHTVVNELGTFNLHLVPSGIFNPHCTCILANGVVVDPKQLLQEIDSLTQAGVSANRLLVSARAHLVMPYHILLDELEEGARGEGSLGTTRRGIGPAYTDRASRMGIRAGDLLETETLMERLRWVLQQKNLLLTKVYGVAPLQLEEIWEQLREYGQRLAPFIRETEPVLQEASEKDQNLLFEGSQGTLLDLDLGTYPFVTSSSVTALGIHAGAGVSLQRLDTTLGVYKAYTTRVGSGPMPTEMESELGELIRQRANEFGATTGRPRNCGWFDAVAARYSQQVNRFNSLAITRLDVLDILPTINICVAYRINGATTQVFPNSAVLLDQCEPVYEELPGWLRDTSHARSLKDLPPQAKAYVHRLEEVLGCRADLISVGAMREQTVVVKSPFRHRR